MAFIGCAGQSMLTWQPSLQGVQRPSGRAGHSCTLTVSEDGKPVIAVFGGRGSDGLCSDCWLLELPEATAA